MSFGLWMNKQVKEIQEGYKREEEAKALRDSFASPDTIDMSDMAVKSFSSDDYIDNSVSDEDYNDYQEYLQENYAKTMEQDDDCDSVHPDRVVDAVSSRARRKAKAVANSKKKKKDLDPDDWIPF